MITLCNFSVFDIITWVLDIGSPINIYNSLQDLQVNRRFRDGERFLNVRDRRSVSVLALGIIKFVFESQYIVLNECHYCLNFFLMLFL